MNTERDPTYEKFVASLHYTKTQGSRRVGVEREFFLYRDDRPDPNAQEFLLRTGTHTEQGDRWTYELSACQVEHRTAPHTTLKDLRDDLVSGSEGGHVIAGFMNREMCSIEVAPADMTLQVYPDPRYAQIAESLGKERLRAACRVAGVHVHVECFGLEDAIRVYEALRQNLPKLARLGDHSDGERLRLYGVVVNNLHTPPRVQSPEHLHYLACQAGWGTNLRSCWWTLRFSRHGTVEVRIFGATSSVDEVMSYVEAVQATIAYI